MKTRKSFKKRFKVTKSGKVMRRTSGQNHIRGKKPGNKIRKIRRWQEVPKPLAKKIKKVLGI
jgi:large subunit ribosomal protein L35